MKQLLSRGKLLYLLFLNMLIVIIFIAILLGVTTLNNQINSANEDVLKFEQTYLTQQQENASDRMSQLLGLVKHEKEFSLNKTKKEIKRAASQIGLAADELYAKYSKDKIKAKALLRSSLEAMLDNSGFKSYALFGQNGQIINLNGGTSKGLSISSLKDGPTKNILTSIQSSAIDAEGGFFVKLYKDENSFELDRISYSYKIDGLNWIVTIMTKDFSEIGGLQKTLLTKIKDYTSRSFQPIHVLDKEGTVLYSSLRQDVGRNIANDRDAKNSPYVKDALNQVKTQGRANVTTSWNRDGNVVKKITIARAVPEFKWIVMVTNNGLDRKALETVHIYNEEVSSKNDLVILFIVIVFALALGYYLSTRLVGTIMFEINEQQHITFKQEEEIKNLQDKLDRRENKTFMEEFENKVSDEDKED
jgi:hypothetical protein